MKKLRDYFLLSVSLRNHKDLSLDFGATIQPFLFPKQSEKCKTNLNEKLNLACIFSGRKN